MTGVQTCALPIYTVGEIAGALATAINASPAGFRATLEGASTLSVFRIDGAAFATEFEITVVEDALLAGVVSVVDPITTTVDLSGIAPREGEVWTIVIDDGERRIEHEFAITDDNVGSVTRVLAETFADAVVSWKGVSSDQYPGYDKMVASILATTPQKIIDTNSGFVGTPDEVVKKIMISGLPFDQVIREFDRWTHVSIPNHPGDAPRRQALIIDRMGTRAYG